MAIVVLVLGRFSCAALTWSSDLICVRLGDKVLDGVGVEGSPGAVGLRELEAVVVRVGVVADFAVGNAGKVVHPVNEVGPEEVRGGSIGDSVSVSAHLGQRLANLVR